MWRVRMGCRLIKDWWQAAALVLLFLGFWQLMVQLLLIPDWILPGPCRILQTFLATAPLMLGHVRVTLSECLVGFAVSIVLAFLIALLMDGSSLIRKALYPLLVFSQTVPIISVAPLFIIWFGYGILPKIIVVILVCFFPVTISLLDGLTGIDREYLELFRSMRAGRLATFRMVKLPLALPSFFSGLRIAAAYSVMGAVIGEWLGAKEGLGTYMTLDQRSFQVDRVFAAILAIAACSIILFALVGLLERLFIPWHRAGA